MANVLVYAESRDDAVRKVALEAVTAARRLADDSGGGEVHALLAGPPGNGKTSACRWLWSECRKRNWQWRLVTPDSYATARRGCKAEQAVRQLFTVEGSGIVFFDDMDLALRDREKVKETDDQSVFLNALDGIESREGVAYVFTTNCALDLIDHAFKRPGRIDLVLHIGLPDAELRGRLVARWHTEIRAALDVSQVVSTTDGMSFAEIEEIKNLLILRFLDAGAWDWEWALRQLDANRHELGQRRRPVGFAAARNGDN